MEILETTEETPGWMPQRARHESGAIWCVECNQPFVSCGSKTHNPDHDKEFWAKSA